MNDLTHLPPLPSLIQDWGGEEFLKIMVNAKGFDYQRNGSLYKYYAMGAISTAEFDNSQVEFTMGFDKKWVCKLEWNIVTYTVHLRPLPMTKQNHQSTTKHYKSAYGVGYRIQAITSLAISF